MPTDDELRAELAWLGLDDKSFRAIALLPLVEVAWADRAVQAEEKQKIVEIARGHKLLTRNGAAVLKQWLTERPSNEVFQRGRKLLVALAHHEGRVGRDMPPEALDTVLELCSHVAESAGGLFGIFFTTSAAERRALKEIAETIDQESARHRNPMRGIVGHTISMDWRELMSELGE